MQEDQILIKHNEQNKPKRIGKGKTWQAPQSLISILSDSLYKHTFDEH